MCITLNKLNENKRRKSKIRETEIINHYILWHDCIKLQLKTQIGKLPKGASFEVVVDSIWKGPSKEDIQNAIKMRYGIDVKLGISDM